MHVHFGYADVDLKVMLKMPGQAGIKAQEVYIHTAGNNEMVTVKVADNHNFKNLTKSCILHHNSISEMKHRVPFYSVLLLLLVLTACKPPGSALDPVAYNDAIVEIQTGVVDHFDRFIDLADGYDSLAAIQALDVALDTTQLGIAQLEKMQGYDGDTQLRDAAKNLITHYAKGLDQDFRKLVPVMASHFASLEQLEAADAIREEFAQEEDHLYALLVKAQKDFAVKHKFEVSDR